MNSYQQIAGDGTTDCAIPAPASPAAEITQLRAELVDARATLDDLARRNKSMRAALEELMTGHSMAGVEQARQSML